MRQIAGNRLQHRSPPSRNRIAPSRVSTDAKLEEATSRPKKSLTAGAIAIAGLSLLSACQQPPSHTFEGEAECALVLIDSFDGVFTSHGRKVRGVAEDLGPIDLVAEYDQRDTEASREELPFKRLQREFANRFSSRELGAEQAREMLDTFLVDVSTQSLDLITGITSDINEVEFRNSALNISLGMNQHSLKALVQKGNGEVYQQNLNRALGFDGGASERQRTQAVLDRVSDVVENNQQIQDARQRWRNEVVDFESRNSSVVVSAGNDGGRARELRGQGYRLSARFDENFLAAPEVTVVGALSGPASFASYTRIGDEVDFYVNGTSGWNQGTSFSAPRTSAMMRSTHCENPELNSEQTESQVAQEFGYQFSRALTALRHES